MRHFPTLVLLVATGCAPDLRDWVQTSDQPPGSGRGDSDGDAANPGGTLDTGADLSEVREVQLDSSDHERWIHYDFERQGVVDSDLPWDFAAQRYQIKLNGGVSGDGEVLASILETSDWETVAVPDAGWRTDEADADGDGTPEYVFADWYDYNAETHVLTPRPLVYVLQSVEGRFFKLQILNYYDEAGTSGFLTLRWAELDDPASL